MSAAEHTSDCLPHRNLTSTRILTHAALSSGNAHVGVDECADDRLLEYTIDEQRDEQELFLAGPLREAAAATARVRVTAAARRNDAAWCARG